MNTHDKIVRCRSCDYLGPWSPSDPTCCERPDYDGATAEEAWQTAIASPEVQALYEALKEVVDAADGKGWEQLDPGLENQRAALAAMEKSK